MQLAHGTFSHHSRLTIVSFICAVSLIAACSNRNATATRDDGKKGTFGENGKETLQYLDKLDFTIASVGESVLVKKYKCTPQGTCPPDGVRLMFIPETGAYKRDWQKAMTKDNEGYVVAAVLNVDNTVFADLGLEPGKLAYVWVGQIGATTDLRGLAVYRLDDNGVRAATWSQTSKLNLCTKPNSPTRTRPSIKGKYPDGETCTQISVAQSIFGPRVAYAATARSAFQEIISGLWISCSGGCCEVGS